MRTSIAAIIGGGIGAVFGVLQLVLSLVQLAAIATGLQEGLGLHWIVAGLLFIPVLAFPLLGVVFAFVGAIVGWGLAWWQAGLLFFGPQLAIMLLMGLAVGADTAMSARRGY